MFYSWISFDFLKFLFDGVVLQVWAWKPGDGRELAKVTRPEAADVPVTMVRTRCR